MRLYELPAQARLPLCGLYANHQLMPVTLDAVLAGGMGRAWGDDPQAPAAGLLTLGAFALPAGDAASPCVPAMLAAAPGLQWVCEDAAWFDRIGALLPPGYRRQVRQQYAPDTLSVPRLHGLRVPRLASVHVQPVDDAIWEPYCAAGWGLQFEENFGSLATFRVQGFAVAALLYGEIIGHAGTYAVAGDAMEVQIEVQPRFRSRGVATALAAELLLESLGRGIAPHWDAENPISSRLAQRLGYRLERTYAVHFPEIA